MRLIREPVTTNFSSFTDSSSFGPAGGGVATCCATAIGLNEIADRQSRAACFHRMRGFIVVLVFWSCGAKPQVLVVRLSVRLWSAITGGDSAAGGHSFWPCRSKENAEYYAAQPWTTTWPQASLPARIGESGAFV